MFFIFHQNSLLKKLLAFYVFCSFLLPVFGQSRIGKTSNPVPNKQQTAKVPVEKSTEACNGWRGKITYVQNTNVENVQNKGKGYEKFVRVVQVNAEINLTSGTIGTGKVSIANRDIQDTETHSDNDCGDWTTGKRIKPFIEKHFIQFDEIGAASGKVPVTVSMEGSDYNIDIFMPPARGTSTMRGKSSQKGYCKTENDFEKVESPIENEKQFDAVRFPIKGKIDPKNPNVLRGSVKYDPDITVTWDLTRVTGGSDCEDGELAVSDVKFEHHVFPNKTDWQEVDEDTVDGNQVKITATVSNSSKKPKSGTVTIKETKSGATLTTKSVSVPGEGEAKVEFLWDTNGYAWNENAHNGSEREIEVSVGDDVQDKAIMISPKPVVLVHGLWSNAAAWSEYQNYLSEAHSLAWKAFAVGADPYHGKMNTGDHFGNREKTYTIFQNAQELGKQIRFTQESLNAWHIDVVAHSMGGLISRFYIHNFMADAPEGTPTITHLVMLGTPNQGSPCADLMDSVFNFLDDDVTAIKQLKPDFVADFNSKTFNRKNVKFSILAGVKIPGTCHNPEAGDGVVPLSSALYNISDRAFVFEVHTSLTSEEDFKFFVKPRLAVGPKKYKQNQLAAVQETKSENDFYANPLNLINKNWTASTNPKSLFAQNFPAGEPIPPHIVLSKKITVEPGQATEVPLNLPANQRKGITFLSAPSMTVSLVDADGNTQQSVSADSPQAAEIFKNFYLNEKTNGNWKLRFENSSDQPQSAAFIVWSDDNVNKLEFTEIQPQENVIKIQINLIGADNVSIKGADVAVDLTDSGGKSVTLKMFDDGQHGDNQANDGIYGGNTEKIVDGNYLIQATATVNGKKVSNAIVLNVSAN